MLLFSNRALSPFSLSELLCFDQARSSQQGYPPMALTISVAAVLFLVLPLSAATTADEQPTCVRWCGAVAVPYPFGIGPAGCYWPSFNLTCDTSRQGDDRLLLGDGSLQVVDISIPDSAVRVLRTGDVDVDASGSGAFGGGLSDEGPYRLSTRNELIVLGCNVEATIQERNSNTTMSGCTSSCADNSGMMSEPGDYNICSGYGLGCCKSHIAFTYTVVAGEFMYSMTYDVQLKSSGGSPSANGTAHVFVAEQGAFRFNQDVNWDTKAVPVVLDWELRTSNDTMVWSHDTLRRVCKSNHSFALVGYSRGHTCTCGKGYQGNPYVTDGCQDIDECNLSPDDAGCFGECANTVGSFQCWCPRGSHGDPTVPKGCVKSATGLSIGIGVGSGAAVILLILMAIIVTRKFKQRRARKLKQKFFKRNRGQLLQQLLSQRADIAEKMIITLDDLAKATNNFDKNRELGGGGHGTVYKGILLDLHVVAIKKSKIVIQKEIDEFINEVAILSQINHRNVVKLIGCCLETEVPLLVYEFISNGTLYHHLHAAEPISISWENRLRIATETAKAIAYLHSSVSVPVIHRDIKSANILLDDTLTPKVSDFGASRYIPIDKTGLTTKVQGTLGYLDPMYFYTGRLTEKSDTYSFGVILVELLTKKKPFSYVSSDGEGLVAHFVSLFGEDDLLQILDPQVIVEGGTEVQQIAALAVACLKLRGDDRPTMTQVELTLQSLQSSKEHALDTARNYSSHIDGSIIEELTRQYSMEEEFMISASYPR